MRKKHDHTSTLQDGRVCPAASLLVVTFSLYKYKLYMLAALQNSENTTNCNKVLHKEHDIDESSVFCISFKLHALVYFLGG